jgi:hypothetical protein
MGQTETSSSPVDASSFHYVVGIDIGSQTCSFCTLKPDKSQVIKPTRFPNALSGFTFLHEQLERLGVAPNQVLIGLEATSRDARKSLSLPGKPGIAGVEARIPVKPISLLKPRGLRAKTDTLDASTIARVLRETVKLVGAMFQQS